MEIIMNDSRNLYKPNFVTYYIVSIFITFVTQTVYVVFVNLRCWAGEH
jgi:hypothetical protein